MIKIKILVPEYYKSFKCVADKCPDTCCAGWEVNLDENAVKKYQKIKGKLGGKIKKYLDKDEDEDYIFKLKNNRCPFLNNKNLCEIFSELGEESLCKTCTYFPRFFEDYGNFREMGLGLGCPEVTRIIFENDVNFSFVNFKETEEKAEEIDEDFLKILLLARKEIFAQLDGKETLKNKLKSVIKIAKEIQKSEEISDEKSFADCINVLSEMEFIDTERKNLYLSLTDEIDESFYEKYHSDFVKLMKYYVQRYFLKSVFDGEPLTKIKYGVFAVIITGRLYNKTERMEAIWGYSKEIEYSDVNMEILDKAMYYDFTSENLINLI